MLLVSLGVLGVVAFALTFPVLHLLDASRSGAAGTERGRGDP